MEHLVFFGPGRVALALGQALVDAGAVASLAYHGRHPEPPDHPLFTERLATYRFGVALPPPETTAVFLTVPDRDLQAMAEVLATRGAPAPGTPVFHCSGALGAEPLAALHEQGYAAGTLHPLQSIADGVTGAARLPGSSFALSGAPEATAAGRRIVSALGGHVLTVPAARRPLYHAAAVFAANYVVVLLRTAARLLVDAGASPEEAERAAVQLARGTLDNASRLGLERVLTGPLMRGDPELVGLHLRALEARDAALYAELGLRALEMARPELDPEIAAAIEALLRRHG